MLRLIQKAAVTDRLERGCMSRAKTIMVQGTASSVGKSTLVTGLCRIFAQDGWRVAPFKAQNMALNSFVTKSGGEIGRAQAVQAEAAGVAPTVEMNPILLKPEGHARSQVIVMGRPLATLEAREYYRNRFWLRETVEYALTRLRDEYDLVIIEGAGSPVELNLVSCDLANMQVAHLAEAPVLLIGDIDRGGIFASLLGTLMLLSPTDHARVKGLIVNKFRGDLTLWQEGEQILAERSGLPVLGTIPMFNDIWIAEEDSVALDDDTRYAVRDRWNITSDMLEVVVVRLPYLSNYDEFDALAAEPAVHLRFIARPSECPDKPDLIILPGTKNTLSDLDWLWRQGLAQYIRQWAKKGSAVLGICGGYQMLGERLGDFVGAEAEAGTVEPGLSLLPVETFFEPISQKVTVQCQAEVEVSAMRGLFAHLQGQDFQVYQIHLGRTVAAEKSSQDGTCAFQTNTTGNDGWLSSDGWCAGCYLHGLFENDNFRQSIVATLAGRRSTQLLVSERVSFDRQVEYDKLADRLRKHVDMYRLKALCCLTDWTYLHGSS
jgi:adenosylcobyric acid synthase